MGEVNVHGRPSYTNEGEKEESFIRGGRHPGSKLSPPFSDVIGVTLDGVADVNRLDELGEFLKRRRALALLYGAEAARLVGAAVSVGDGRDGAGC